MQVYQSGMLREAVAEVDERLFFCSWRMVLSRFSNGGVWQGLHKWLGALGIE